ncbi:MAG: SprT family zinc-dependent metalloprotease [Bacteroidales bacterium]|jgi:predicted metal-dependent hydrolase|nr:SprT family zinc-dependent metalloprotease [Bacteroidales bacterium]
MHEVFLDEIGLVKMTKNGRAKRNYNFKIQQDGTVRVSIPPRGSYKEAESLLKSMKDKILAAQERLKTQMPARKHFDFDTIVSTRYAKITFHQTDKTNVHYYIDDEGIKLYIPKIIDIKAEETQAMIFRFIEEMIRKEAKLYIPYRVEELAEKHNFSYGNVKITSAKTRWGSCSGKNNLNFSLHLMQLPDELIDYVILHELCHTIHKNHGKAFYEKLNEVCDGNHEKLNAQLKTRRIGSH